MDTGNTISKILKEFGLEKANFGTYSGDWHSNGGEEIASVSPIDGSILAKVSTSSEKDYEIVLKKSQEAFRKWREVPPPKRGNLIREIGNELRKEKERLGMIVSLEVGKTISEGQGEIQEMIDVADFATGLSRQLYGLDIASERPDHRLSELWQPLGVVAVISSFNFPSSVWSWNSFIAAVCGDAVIWKPSSKAPLTAIAVMRVVERVIKRMKMPEIFSLVTGSGKVIGDRLANDPAIPLISFTGSIPVGKGISEKVASRFGRTILELGGNNAAIVSDKADLEIALKGVAFGALATSGQRCTTTRRAIIHEKIYDAFVSRLKDIYSSVRIGDPLEPGTLVGPLIDDDAVKKFLSAIRGAEQEGGVVLHGGKRIRGKGYGNGHYVTPALIEANPNMKTVREETFAPILYLFKYRTMEEALEIHNSVPQGLSSSIFTTDLREEGEFLSAHGSDCGLANVNTGTAGAEIGGAFGGEKQTGGGRESGSDSWKLYMRRQTVTRNYGRTLPLAQDVQFRI